MFRLILIFAAEMRIKTFFVWCVSALFYLKGALAQAPVAVDSLTSRELEEVVITATRTEREVGLLPMPVSIISKSQIRSLGSVRLNDVLSEQAGLLIVPQVNGQGNGLQLQGFNPDYTLILIDGEPIIGRNTGSLELSRIAVGNIRQIEIVKGPSSSLYGSEALAGVVNIITERPPAGTSGQVSARYGTNQTVDLNGDIGFSNEKGGAYFFVNRFRTDGYDLSPERFGNTVSPFASTTLTGKVSYRLTPATEFAMAGRYFQENQSFQFEVFNNNDSVRTFGDGRVTDWNINPTLTTRFSDRWKATARFYATGYRTRSQLDSKQLDTTDYNDFFNQTFARPEVTTEYFLNEKHMFTAGVGHIEESVETSRYGEGDRKRQSTSYGFFQWEWQALPKWSVISGGRFDYNSIYGSQFSPKLSTRYEFSDRFAVKASGGIGFKAPDFRQLYLNFFNTAGGGYTVLGTEVAPGRLAELEAAGQITSYLFDPALLGQLKAETSYAINAGATWQVMPRLGTEVNFFHNSIDNLIETQAVAVTTANQTVFSYRNIRRAFTQGLEVNANYRLAPAWTLSAGYQLLYAKDKDVVASVKRGEVFWRDPETLASSRLRPREYFGLYNRSRHMGNVKLFYRHPSNGWEGTVRAIYRGKYGVGDLIGNIQGEVIPPSNRTGNSILDVHDDFVSGYVLVNVSMAKSLRNGFRFQVGIDNLFNHTEPVFIPNLPGRLAYITASYSFKKKTSQ